MKTKLDPDSPIPLYHQIAEAIRYRIATGRLVAGDRLPGVREAAAQFGVNLHTVRRAYGDLRNEGLVESKAALGTRVKDPSPRRTTKPSAELDEFLRRVLHEARQRHKLSPLELTRRLLQAPPRRSKATAWVVECSESQCEDHVAEISSYLDVDARPWSLEQGEEPPPGEVLATYFHHNEIRQAWPRRLGEVYFLRIEPDPDLLSDPRLAAKGKRGVRVRLCEFDAPMASNIASDLRAVFPPKVLTVDECVVDAPGALLRNSKARSPVLFPPRVWAQLEEEHRRDPRAIHLRYVLAPGELEAVASHFQWPARVGR